MIKYLTKIFFLLLISNSYQSCNGQIKSEPKQKETKTTEIGKAVSELDNQIWAVFQDKKGNFWFGSNGTGIYFYDGKELKQFTQNDGLISNQIRGIQEDIKGNVYIETPDGVNKFDGIEFTTLEVIKSTTNRWKLEPNDLWFNCNGNANNVYRYDGQNLYELNLPTQDIENTLGIRKSENPYTVFGINKDKNGNIWFGTVLAGAFRFDGKSFLWIGEKELSRLPDGREPGVRSILEDSDGNIWLSNFKSKYSITPNSTKEYERIKAVDLSEEIVRDKILYFNSGIADNEGNLWMTTYGGGVWKYDGQDLLNFEINNGEEDLLLICIYQDTNGTLWLGTNNDGVYKQTGKGFEKFEPKHRSSR
ncbi:two-component regulator propeller domain-containing protein [Tenacibaculum tangerinum]|uniref:Two-component regulator propeller domain-containing protein n=1 Tax=Tenacibaculum tangerinum TaxID=3038772 RepID=A0ABY8L4A2_9FLAO|nr:two-component regulator propeller domain-containing protein [Tenacibaculum tangerinum]WGH76257.1 two-component regulator propeller domain-containing protein [Tenacibaculum tangerinum]